MDEFLVNIKYELINLFVNFILINVFILIELFILCLINIYTILFYV